MSKRRMLDIAIWSNDNFMELPAYGRLLQIGLINFADDQGRCKGSPVYLRSQIFPGDTDHINNEEIRRWLNVMAANGTILIYQVEGRDYIQLLNWWKFQSLQYAQPSDYPPPDGWKDRICFNGKGHITLFHNWVKADGREVADTCDAQGEPLPFVEQLPRKNQGGRPPKQGKENVEENMPQKEAQKEASFPPPNIIKYNINQSNREEEETRESNNNAADAARPPSVSLKDHPAIKAFHELHNRYPSKPQMAAIIENDPPLEDWRRAIQAWALAGHNPTNVQGMIDWALDLSRFENGGRPASKVEQRKTGYSDFIGEAPPPEQDRLAWRAKLNGGKPS